MADPGFNPLPSWVISSMQSTRTLKGLERIRSLRVGEKPHGGVQSTLEMQARGSAEGTVLAGPASPRLGGGPEELCPEVFLSCASTQAAPLAMIYDDLGLFCKHSPNQGGSYIPRVFLHGWDCSKIISLVLHCKSSEVVGPRTGAG